MAMRLQIAASRRPPSWGRPTSGFFPLGRPPRHLMVSALIVTVIVAAAVNVTVLVFTNKPTEDRQIHAGRRA